MIATKPSAAQTSAQIALRGIVPPRAAIAFANVAGSATIDLAMAVRKGTAVVDLSTMGNSVSHVQLSLIASAAAERGKLALTAADGARIPYRLRFEGQDLDLARGEAPLAAEGGVQHGALEVIAPEAAKVTKGYSDHLVVVLTAR
jgi:hypothetical protein